MSTNTLGEEIDNLLNNDLQISKAIKLLYELISNNKISEKEARTNLNILGFKE